jgi:hypothetical protein
MREQPCYCVFAWLFGCLAGCRDEVARAVGNRQFTFSLLVHSDASSPMVDWSQNSSILQVRAGQWSSAAAAAAAIP